jgi:phage terminase large subunit-like protein
LTSALPNASPSRQQKIELLMLLEEKERRFKEQALARHFAKLYPWQHKFNAATATFHSCMLMAANQVGKSRTGCILDAYHLTGDYPEGWTGHRFSGPITAWLLGYSGEKTRDLLQAKLFGELNSATRKFEGGYIKAADIVDYKGMTGTPGAVREVRVKHKDGGISVCQFWSYSQGQHALMGDVVDWYHIDEEPRDKSIYPQVLTRTINGDKGKGGRGILTFTPENGRTELVVQFMDTPGTSDYLQRATWNDAPHLGEATKARLLSAYPAWQKDMRSKGEPLLGAGLIFDIDDERIKCQSFECPAHWWIINGLDFGWDHPQAHVQLWWDKDTDTVYLAHAWRKSRAKPNEAWVAVRPWAKDVPTAWPADGLQHEKGSGEGQKKSYVDEGFKMLPEHATWQGGGVSVEQGLVELYRAMDDGKFKVFSHLSPFFEEKMNYHRDENGHVVKVQDDVLSAVRYAWMMRRYAVQRCKIGGKAHNPKVVMGHQSARRTGR